MSGYVPLRAGRFRITHDQSVQRTPPNHGNLVREFVEVARLLRDRAPALDEMPRNVHGAVRSGFLKRFFDAGLAHQVAESDLLKQVLNASSAEVQQAYQEALSAER